MVITRQTINIEVVAWVMGPLAVHVSAAARGLTVTHVPSGLRLQSRLNKKERALAMVERLLQLPESVVNWQSLHPITDDNKEVIRQIVNEVPKRLSRQPGRPTTGRTIHKEDVS
jgi:hypothetical protein